MDARVIETINHETNTTMKTPQEWLLEVEHRVEGLWESDVKGIQDDAIAQLTKERDELDTQLRAWHSEFGTNQLTHATAFYNNERCRANQMELERDDLKLILTRLEVKVSHAQNKIDALEKERDDLRAKLERAEAACAAYRDVLTDIEMRNEEYERVCPGCYEPIMDIHENLLETEHSPTCKFVYAISTQCGTGWLSPEKAVEIETTHTEIVAKQLFLRTQAEEKAGRLRDALIDCVVSLIGPDDDARLSVIMKSEQALAETEAK